MAATVKWFGLAQGHIANGAIDWDNDTIKVSLHTSTWSPAQDTHNFHDDATNELAASGGYTAGGATIANRTSGYTAGTNVQKLDGDDVTWSALTPSAAFRYGAIYKDRGGASSADELIAWIDFGANVDPGGQDFTIAWHTDGILTLTAAA
jgi:hypothetical protein